MLKTEVFSHYTSQRRSWFLLKIWPFSAFRWKGKEGGCPQEGLCLQFIPRADTSTIWSFSWHPFPGREFQTLSQETLHRKQESKYVGQGNRGSIRNGLPPLLTVPLTHARLSSQGAHRAGGRAGNLGVQRTWSLPTPTWWEASLCWGHLSGQAVLSTLTGAERAYSEDSFDHGPFSIKHRFNQEGFQTYRKLQRSMSKAPMCPSLDRRNANICLRPV